MGKTGKEENGSAEMHKPTEKRFLTKDAIRKRFEKERIHTVGQYYEVQISSLEVGATRRRRRRAGVKQRGEGVGALIEAFRNRGMWKGSTVSSMMAATLTPVDGRLGVGRSRQR
ncbi:hypothetical protein D1007_02955 [Hordeum vulgare]|nr:hypothetical protein D1007_02955 [Hordeum vulgare]